MTRSETPDGKTPSARKQRGVTTILDVARRAGVSPMTVSRVVNGEKNVRPSTRAAVMSAVKALNYAPNPAARTLAGAEAARVGLLYSNPSAAYLSEFLVGALDEASRTSVQIMLEKSEATSGAAERAAVRKLVASGAAGVILPPPLCESEDVLAELKQAGLPTVAVASGRFNAEISCVRINDYAAAYEMTNYLLDLGHRRIGSILGHPNQTGSAERERGFTAALADAGVRNDPGLTVQGYFSYRSGLDAAETLLTRRVLPTAIFASNDDMAAAVVSVAHRKGLDVPGDLSVVGFDDTSIATTIWPELTTIRQPITAMAEIALDLILREIRSSRRNGNTPMKPVDHLVTYSLVKRSSAAAPKTP
ncbi:MAG TPA: LacI family DNA-binding transcriptional regulator [Rhizomicrobium sp.]|nr:LacI family DNA-binding transcriptional regulator [Rhizomicrobium sp.]